MRGLDTTIKLVANRIICTKVDAGVARPARVSDTGFIRLIKYETGMPILINGAPPMNAIISSST